MARVLILGATSDIAKALANEYAQHGYDLYLATRQSDRLDPDIKDISIRYQVNVKAFEFDATAFETHASFYNELDPQPDGVICVFGYLGDQKKGEKMFSEAHKIIDVNHTGAISILEKIAADFEHQKRGFIIGISSVAGDRGRQSNYLYGSAKAGFSAYLSGLRNRLFKSGIHVLTVKPGFVATKMTASLKLPPFLTAQPDTTAKAIYKAHIKKKDVLYVTGIWWWIMTFIRYIPEPIFKRLGL
ncbi:MAG: SDR family oxidoreductase [Kiritimatiellae bacterium]|nr:SDR family oxidoreductase [Kiritimatiellia bacterium]